jgi:CHAT domain-containing protein
LFSGEIYNLELNANLVTLSACQTGLGKISKGEGVIGLSRALVYAGARNIIVSFWSVADESTSELMKNFYRTLLNEKSSNYTSSLREAKLKLIHGDKYSSPYYWAPFILIGY